MDPPLLVPLHLTGGGVRGEKPLAVDLPGPKLLARCLETLDRNLAGGQVRPPYDYGDLVERFSRQQPLSARDLRKLPYCLAEGQPPLMDRPCLPQALEVLTEQLEAGRGRALGGAIYCLLRHPTSRTQGFELLRRWVEASLKRHGPRHRQFEHWLRHLELFGTRGPEYLARLLCQASSLREGFKQSRLPSQCWLLHQALVLLGGWTAVGQVEKRSEFYSFVEEGGYSHLIPRIVESALLGILNSDASLRRVPDIEAFFLKNLGHPSMDRKGLWQAIDELARDLARKWVNEKNIKLFYEHLVQGGDKHRLHFWMQYLDQVDDVRIVVGSNDSYSRNPEIRSALGREIAYLRDAPSSVSAVFLKVGQWWIVEFSQVGNATFGYRTEHKPAGFWWASSYYSIHRLKAGINWPHRVIHPAGNLRDSEWRQEYAARLRVALNNEFPPAVFVPRR